MMSDSRFRRLTQMQVSVPSTKTLLQEKEIFSPQREEEISSQHLVSGKLTVDRNFGATLKFSSRAVQAELSVVAGRMLNVGTWSWDYWREMIMLN